MFFFLFVFVVVFTNPVCKTVIGHGSELCHEVNVNQINKYIIIIIIIKLLYITIKYYDIKIL